MTAMVSCPRCLGTLRAPNVWSSDWKCETHGAVLPYRVVPGPHAGGLRHRLAAPGVPVWMPWPMPVGWVVTGLATVGDERSGVRASALALSGPNLSGGAADLVIVAEDPGVGLGARLAGITGPDPGELGERPDARPDAKVRAAHHPTPLWDVPTSEDCDALYGEARGVWLSMVFWPSGAGLLLEEDLSLVDLRDQPERVDAVPYGAPCPHLAAVPPQAQRRGAPSTGLTPPD